MPVKNFKINKSNYALGSYSESNPEGLNVHYCLYAIVANNTSVFRSFPLDIRKKAIMLNNQLNKLLKKFNTKEILIEPQLTYEVEGATYSKEVFSMPDILIKANNTLVIVEIKTGQIREKSLHQVYKQILPFLDTNFVKAYFLSFEEYLPIDFSKYSIWKSKCF